MRRLSALLGMPLAAVSLAACGSQVATSSFTGTKHDVAQTLSDLQSDVTSGDEKKVCQNDLASAVVSSLHGTAGCEAAVKTQLSEIDSTELTIKSVNVEGSSATAKVESVFQGKKNHQNTVKLVDEKGRWKLAALE